MPDRHISMVSKRKLKVTDWLGSIHSDKAVQDIQALGISMKQVGKDGVTSWKPVGDVLQELMIKSAGVAGDMETLDKAASGGKYQWAKFAASIGDFTTYIKDFQTSIDSTGSTVMYAGVQMDTLAKKFDQAHEHLIGLMNATGQNGLTTVIKGAVDTFIDFITGLEHMSAGAIATIAAVTGLLVVVPKLATSLGTITNAFKRLEEAEISLKAATTALAAAEGNLAKATAIMELMSGAVLPIILAIGAAVAVYAISTGSAANATADLTKAQKDAKDQAAQWVDQLGKQIDALKQYASDLKTINQEIAKAQTSASATDKAKIPVLQNDKQAVLDAMSSDVGYDNANYLQKNNFSDESIAKVTESMQKQKDEMQKLNNEGLQLDATTLAYLRQYEDVNKQLQSGTLSSDQYAKKQNELVNITKQLNSIQPELLNHLTEQGVAVTNVAAAYEKLIAADEKKKLLDTKNSVLNYNDNMKKLKDDYANAKNKYELDKSMEQNSSDQSGQAYGFSHEEADKAAMEKANEAIQQAQAQGKSLLSQYFKQLVSDQSVTAAAKITDTISTEIDKLTSKMSQKGKTGFAEGLTGVLKGYGDIDVTSANFDKFVESAQKYTLEQTKSKKAADEMKKSLDDLRDSTIQDTLKNLDFSSATQQVSDKFSSAGDNIKEVGKMIYDIQKGNQLNPEDVMKLVDKIPELSDAFSVNNGVVEANISKLQDYKNNAISDAVNGSKALQQTLQDQINLMLEAIKTQYNFSESIIDSANKEAVLQEIMDNYDKKNPGKKNTKARDDFQATAAARIDMLAKQQDASEKLGVQIEQDSKIASQFGNAAETAAQQSTDKVKQLTDAYKQYQDELQNTIDDQLTTLGYQADRMNTASQEYQNNLKEQINLLEEKKKKIDDEYNSLKNVNDMQNNITQNEQNNVNNPVTNATGGGNVTNNNLGWLSAKYESGTDTGAISGGQGDLGGKSYGSFQLASNTGSLQGFVNFLASNNPTLYNSLAGLTLGSSDFDSAWKYLASHNKDQFQLAQQAFIKKEFYNPAESSILNKLGIDINSRSSALQDVLFSTAVQHGAGGALSVFRNAGINASMSDKDIINRIYDERGANGGEKYFSGNSSAVIAGVLNRFANERQDALAELGVGNSTAINVQKEKQKELNDTANADGQAQNEIDQKQKAMLDSLLQGYEDKINSASQEIERSKTYGDTLDKNTFGYRNELEVQQNLLKVKQDTTIAERNLLQQQLQTNKQLSPRIVQEYTQKLDDMNTTIQKNAADLKGLQNDEWASQLNEQVKSANNTLKDYQKEVSDTQTEISKFDKTNDKNYWQERITDTQKLTNEMETEAKFLQNNIDILDKQSQTMDQNSDAYAQNRQQRDDWSNQLEQLNTQMNDTNTQLQKDFADQLINVYQEAMDKQKTMRQNMLDQEAKDMQKAHDNKVKLWDDEQKTYESVINAEMKALDNQKNNNDYADQLQKAQKDAQDTQSQINKLAMNNSAEGNNKRTDLLKQLADQNAAIQKMQSDHELELRKQSLQDQLDAEKTANDKRKQNADDLLNSQKDAIDNEKTQIDYEYQQMIDDEQKWSKMREDILKGHYDTVQKELSDLVNQYNLNMNNSNNELGKKFNDQLNTLQKMKDLLGSINVLTGKTPDGTKTNNQNQRDYLNGIINNSKDAGQVQWAKGQMTQLDRQDYMTYLQGVMNTGSAGQKQWATQRYNAYSQMYNLQNLINDPHITDQAQKTQASNMLALYNSLANYYKVADNAKTSKDRDWANWVASQLEAAVGAENAKNNPYSSTADLNYANLRLEEIKKSLAVLKLPIYHDGGIVGSTSSDTVNKLFNVGGDEEIAKLLKGEVVIPPNKFPNMLSNIQNILANGAKFMALTGGLNIDVQIGQITGDEKGGKTVVSTIVSEMKKLGFGKLG